MGVASSAGARATRGRRKVHPFRCEARAAVDWWDLSKAVGDAAYPPISRGRAQPREEALRSRTGAQNSSGSSSMAGLLAQIGGVVRRGRGGPSLAPPLPSLSPPAPRRAQPYRPPPRADPLSPPAY